MKTKQILRMIPALLALFAASLACTRPAAPEISQGVTRPPSEPGTAVQSLPSAAPTPTASPAPLPTPTAATTSETENGLTAAVRVDSLNLRSGPGTMFDIIGQVYKNNLVKVLGRVPGDDWVQVITADGSTGYMLADFLELDSRLTLLPQITIRDSYIVLGKVVDEDGTAINDITVAVYQGDGAQTLRTDAVTDERGIFTAYLPLDSAYTWTVSVVGVGCTSRIVDENCTYPGSFGTKATARFELPLNKQITLLYEQP